MTTGAASAHGPIPEPGRVTGIGRPSVDGPVTVRAAGPTEAAARPVTVRAARPVDAPALSRLEGLSTSTRRALTRDLARANGPQAEVVVLVAEAGPHHLDASSVAVVGAALGQVLVDEGHVLDLAVDPAHRGAGIGRTLLAALLQQLTGRGATAHTLEVRPTNLEALGLYRAAGFAVEGRRPRYYPDGEDALLLWRRDEEGRT